MAKKNGISKSGKNPGNKKTNTKNVQYNKNCKDTESSKQKSDSSTNDSKKLVGDPFLTEYLEKLRNKNEENENNKKTNFWRNKVFTYSTLIVFLTIIGILVPVFINQSNVRREKEKEEAARISEIDSIRNCINEKIDLIERTFKLDNYISNGDTLIYLEALNNFKQNTLSFCSYFKAIESTKPISYYKDMPTETFVSLAKNEITRCQFIDNTYEQVQANIAVIKILELFIGAKEHNIIMTELSEAKFADLVSSIDKRKANDSIKSIECIKLLKLANNGIDIKENLNKAMIIYDGIKNNVAYYKGFDDFLAYIIDCHIMFENSKYLYKDKKKEDMLYYKQ